MRDQIVTGAEAAWAVTLAFLPKFAAFLAILIVGYFVSRWIGRLVNRILERVGFDRLVERGGIKRALAKSNYDASDILCKIAFYTMFLLVLQLAFGVFGPNPVSDILTRVIAFLPTLFVSLLIVVVSAAIAKGVKDILQAVLGGLSYGRFLARIAATAVVVTGVFAALSHLQIAPAIVNGLFYTMLVIVAGSAIVAIGGSGIEPLRPEWERVLGRVRSEGPRIVSEAEANAPRAQEQLQSWKEEATPTGEENRVQRAASGSVPAYEAKGRNRP